MPRNALLLLLLLLVGTTALTAAQESEPPPEEAPLAAPIRSAAGRVFGPLSGVWEPVELEPVDGPPAAPSITAGHASDLCSTAAPLALDDGTDGDQSLVSNMSASPDDPVLACMWGAPSSSRGYRTVWYRFEAPATGRLIVSANFNPANYEQSYDTVIAVYHSPDGDCETLTTVACDDDTHGFLSEANAFVRDGEDYYIEVADWSLGVQGDATLNLGVVLQESDSFWEQLPETMPSPRTRHAVVTDGRSLYIIAGEDEIGQRVGSTWQFDTQTRTWTELAPMPSPGGFFGYSRTSAAFLGNRIFVPSGFVGDDNTFSGVHRMFVPVTNSWHRVGSDVNPWADEGPVAYMPVVAAPSFGGYFVLGGLLRGDGDPAPPSEEQVSSRLLFFAPDAVGASGTWNLGLPPMSRGRYAHTAALLNTAEGQKVCVTAGVGKDEQNETVAVVLRSAECYNISSGEWEEIAPLTIGRFSAGSAVGPDGRWYVFGGVGVDQDGAFVPVLKTEVYDPATDTWEILDSRFDLVPGRAWPRGAFVNGSLWVFGGEQTPDHPRRQVIPLAERLLRPHLDVMLPFVAGLDRNPSEPNDSFATALPLALGQPQWHDFNTREDYFDIFRFVAPEDAAYVVRLDDIPDGHNYDLYLYTPNKFRLDEGTRIGNQPELIATPLGAGVYYAMVLRAAGEPTSNTYRILVRRQ